MRGKMEHLLVSTSFLFPIFFFQGFSCDSLTCTVLLASIVISIIILCAPKLPKPKKINTSTCKQSQAILCKFPKEPCRATVLFHKFPTNKDLLALCVDSSTLKGF